MLISVQPTKIDISDQETVLDEMTKAYGKFEIFLNKMQPAWNDMDSKEQQMAISSGKFPLIAYAQYMQTVLNKWFRKET